jgi:hypothetical protein
MANEKQTIRVLTEPTIILDDLVANDTETGTNPNFGSPETAYKPSKQYGGAFPLLQVNSYPFTSEQIVEMRLSSSGERPYITVKVLVRDKSFYSTSFPKDGDLLSVFVRGKVDPFKPIRNDYEITYVNVYSDPGSGENTYDEMTISGTLRIPGYDAVKCFSIRDTSMKAILKTATDLKLGFATNEVATSDSQVWICPNEKVKNFMQETTLSAWKDENSFFTYFIDQYYYVNFVNVEPFYAEQPDIEEAISILRMSQDYGKDSEIHKSLSKTVLSNWEDISQTQFFINHYSLLNNSSSISLRNGYKRYAQFYDGLLQENQSFFVDPKTTEGSEREKQLLRGRPQEDFYLSQINTKWMGVQYGKDGENSHPKYNYSRVNNFQNVVHTNKMGLKVSLANCNFNLRRMHTIPVIIMIQKDTVRKVINEPIDEDQQKSNPNSSEPNRTKSAAAFDEIPFTVDKTISGYYVIDSIEYIYEKGNFRQECTLLRREWPTPPQTH